MTLASLMLLLSPFAACSASSSSPSSNGGSSSAGTGGSGADGGSAGFGGSLLDSGNDAELPECATDSYTGAVIPLDIYVLLDRSDSMLDADTNGLQRWSAITQAIKNFVDLPGNSGIGLGLGYFPVALTKPLPTNCTNADGCFPYIAQCTLGSCCYGNLCNEKPTSSCLPTDYVTPAIAIQALPGVAAMVKQSIDNTNPEGGTPMGPALEGAIDYVQTWAAAHPDHITAVVLATDGAPSGCNPEGTDVVAARAEEGKNQNPSVLTFVIGLGEQLSTLNSIALAGGTKSATLVDSGVNAGQEFLDALNKIRGDLQCTYSIPVPKQGDVDPEKVNVTFTQAGIREFVPRVDGAANCGLGDTAGWYYDTPTNPSRITLCKHSCEAVQGGGVTVDVVLGCQTVVK
ncbi:MAG: VWA domain-containing protein [Polyangiaceae bacterium]|nr:VWA domain-containing protein [Myxococcales bacterium]MCB9585504.1 VWA domain-containing protein [Polyangiaceae bacterium]MCB9606480.1 VWA domain-containing protein [Polyangiaceae bacterium]